MHWTFLVNLFPNIFQSSFLKEHLRTALASILLAD